MGSARSRSRSWGAVGSQVGVTCAQSRSADCRIGGRGAQLEARSVGQAPVRFVAGDARIARGGAGVDDTVDPPRRDALAGLGYDEAFLRARNPALIEVTTRNRKYRSDKAIRELGYAPSPLAQGVEDCWRWYRDRGEV